MMKKLLLVYGLLLAFNSFAENIIYTAGDELESKKRTTPAVLYNYKNKGDFIYSNGVKEMKNPETSLDNYSEKEIRKYLKTLQRLGSMAIF